MILGDKWDLFKHVMPASLGQHINGNAIYDLQVLYNITDAKAFRATWFAGCARNSSCV